MLRELEFDLICRRHSDEIYRFAYGLLGNKADAEDATQEVLLRIWNHLPRVRCFRLRAWIMETTRNYCRDQIRRRSRPAFPISSDHEALAQHPDSTAPDPAQGADATHWRNNIHAALLQLPRNGIGVTETALETALGSCLNIQHIDLDSECLDLVGWPNGKAVKS